MRGLPFSLKNLSTLGMTTISESYPLKECGDVATTVRSSKAKRLVPLDLEIKPIVCSLASPGPSSRISGVLAQKDDADVRRLDPFVPDPVNDLVADRVVFIVYLANFSNVGSARRSP